MAVMLGYADAQELLAAQPDKQGRLFVDIGQRDAWSAKVQSGDPRGFEAELNTKAAPRHLGEYQRPRRAR